MALNPGILLELEQRGLSNGALEQLLAFLHGGVDGSITWHISRGELRKFELRQFGSLRDAKHARYSSALIKP